MLLTNFLMRRVNTVIFGVQGQNKLNGKLPLIGGMTSLMALRIPDNQLTGRQWVGTVHAGNTE